MPKKEKRGKSEYVNIEYLECASGGDVDLLVRIIDDSCIGSFNGNGRTAMHLAAISGNVAMMELLLLKGESVASRDLRGMTPLHLASEAGHEEAVLFLMDAGASLQELDYDNSSPLHIATQNNHVVLMTLFVELGANLYQRDRDGNTPMDLAIYNENVQSMTLLSSKMNKDFLVNEIGLWKAVQGNHIDALKFLLINLEFDVNSRGCNGINALYIASEYGFDEIARLLIEHGAQFSTSSGYQEMCVAIINNNVEVVDLFIKQGINVNQMRTNSISFLHIAIQNSYTHFVELLINNGADTDQLYRGKMSSIELAIKVQAVESFTLLLEKVSDIDARNSDKSTLLHKAAAVGGKDIVLLLLERGPAIDQINSCGSTALRIAFLRKHYDVAALLIRNGASVYDVLGHLMFESLNEEDSDLYDTMYSQYLSCRIFYKQGLSKEDERFMSSKHFHLDKTSYLKILELAEQTANTLKCIMSEIGATVKLSNVDLLMHYIATFLTVAEMSKISRVYNNSLVDMIERLESDGSIVEDVPKNGDCFFSALGVSLRKPETPDMLRSIAAQHIRSHEEDFFGFAENILHEADSIENPGVWADHLAIQALSNALGLHINIHRLYSDTIQIVPRSAAIDQTIDMLYTGNHYMAIFRPQDVEQPRSQVDESNFMETLFNHSTTLIPDTLDFPEELLDFPDASEHIRVLNSHTLNRTEDLFINDTLLPHGLLIRDNTDY